MLVYDELPPYRDLQPFINISDAAHNVVYETVRASGVSRVADIIHRERFNLRPIDIPLIKSGECDHDANSDVVAAASIDVSWITSVRFLFARHQVFSLTALEPQLFFM